MSILSILYTFLISPLELLFEVIFEVANKIIGNAGLSIIFLSLAVNFLVLPLYKRADELQAEERDIQAKMAYRIKQIKTTFKGDERFMMLQEYYRINHYKPIYALKSSVSLLLQIPFFIAAYNLLSGMQSLKGMQFGFIADLGKEDAMFMIGSFPVNILPILMTLINIISGIIYTKGHPLKAKIQVYGLAAVFLVLLYHSPSGLVFYWLLNNVFSLLKNIFYKLKDPKKVLSIVLAISGAVILVLTAIRPDLDFRQKILLAIGSVLLCVPLISGVANKKLDHKNNKAVTKDAVSFLSGAVFMAFFTGLLIPAFVIESSANEFIDVMHPQNPVLYIVNAMLLSFGSWVLWGGVFYFFMSDKIKASFSRGIWMICGISVIDYMLFGTKLGVLSSTLQYDITPVFKISDYLLNAGLVLITASVFYFVFTKFPKIAKTVLIVGVLSVASLGAYKSAMVWRSYKWFMSSVKASSVEMPDIPLSKNGQNVVVLMLDRALGSQVPYIFNEKPELLEHFDGFTYYPNTISYGAYTNVGSPVLYGGYDYVPENINARDEESLESKQNEALHVMPRLFGDKGYTVTICDPSYAGYKWIPDLSIYDDHPEYNCYITNGKFSIFEDEINSEASVNTFERINDIRNRNFFCFALMKSAPVIIQETLYDGGSYNEAASSAGTDGALSGSDLVQNLDGLTKSDGYNKAFLEAYPVLQKLPDITTISDGSENTFLMLANDTPHSPCLLQEPDYVPALHVDNTQYDADMTDRYTVDGKTMDMSTEEQITHYHVNMATFLQLAKWFDYLRENGVYDNTRIILVSDHGRALDQFDVTCNGEDMESFMPLLMVKDFNATGFTVCEDFMTNGDTPSLAAEGLIDNPENPFTHNPIDQSAKNGPQKTLLSMDFSTEDNNGNTFLPGSWFLFDGVDPRDPKNWTYLYEG